MEAEARAAEAVRSLIGSAGLRRAVLCCYVMCCAVLCYFGVLDRGLGLIVRCCAFPRYAVRCDSHCSLSLSCPRVLAHARQSPALRQRRAQAAQIDARVAEPEVRRPVQAGARAGSGSAGVGGGAGFELGLTLLAGCFPALCYALRCGGLWVVSCPAVPRRAVPCSTEMCFDVCAMLCAV